MEEQSVLINTLLAIRYQLIWVRRMTALLLSVVCLALFVFAIDRYPETAASPLVVSVVRESFLWLCLVLAVVSLSVVFMKSRVIGDLWYATDEPGQRDPEQDDT